MAAIVGVDAVILISTNGTVWTTLPERNEFSIAIKVDTAEHKVFVTSLANAWADKKRTWMAWSGSLSGFYDDADDSIFTSVVAGNVVYLRFIDSRYAAADPTTVTKYWQGQAVLTSVDHKTGTDDFSTLDVDFEGVGALTRHAS